MENLVSVKSLQSFYNNKKVFITGHTGFKGAWLMALLHQLGATVKGYALSPEYNNGLFSRLQPLGIAESIIADIRDRKKLEEEIIAFQPDYIFHLAAQPLVRRSYRIPAETFDVNVTGTANVMEALIPLQKSCAAVIITTDKVYENIEKNVLYTENDKLGGYDPYSASKACAELVISSFRNSFFNINTINEHRKALAAARAGNVIGGGDWSTDRILPDVVRALAKGETIQVRNPHAVRPWQHVLEPLTGYLLLGALLHENAIIYSGAYNFGPMPEDHLDVGNFVNCAIAAWGSGQWHDASDPAAVHEAGFLKLDIKKALTTLGWQPKLNAQEAIKWAVAWYKQPGNAQADFTFEQIKNYLTI
ncbi:MAG TPA: CDP-glucose 4,6-dehydratase [Chitinophagaceae bacterium]|nr:CDP-glucose 4,6-dehydratase [Chitinophagaceae bacterium]